MTTQTLSFEAEVSKLLHMMVHSVYSEREVFLRELISNASDACDKLRHAAITQPELTKDDPDFAISITVDKDAKTLVISDNGIGMNAQDLKENLGTIARSGTARFMEELQDAKKDMSLIGQFGVGFYSVFMVADKVTVDSRKAGEDAAWTWASDGLGSYSISDGAREGRGTTITLHLKDDAEEFLDPQRLSSVVRTYSDHIAIPIKLDKGEGEVEDANSGAALWTRPKSDITEEQYTEFYHHVAGAFDTPMRTIHFRAEGRIEYTSLLFIPETPPFDLFDPARASKVKLYVKRVFITDDVEDLIPGYLRFLRGVVDAQDLALNISREMLQNNPVVTAMSRAITNKVLADLSKLSSSDQEAYLRFWDGYGKVLKEGIYEDFERRDDLLKLARFKTTKSDEWTSLADYIERMKDGQKAIYTISGDNLAALKSSPQLEGFRAKDIEVLLLTDPVDDFWLSGVPEFDGKAFKSVTKGASDLNDVDGEEKKEPEVDDDTKALFAVMKNALGETVSDVRASDRLTDSAVCLVADDTGMDMHIERMLKAHDRLGSLGPRVLEVNADHVLVRALKSKATDAAALPLLQDAAHLLLDQARVMEGEGVEDSQSFARRMGDMMLKALG